MDEDRRRVESETESGCESGLGDLSSIPTLALGESTIMHTLQSTEAGTVGQ